MYKMLTESNNSFIKCIHSSFLLHLIILIKQYIYFIHLLSSEAMQKRPVTSTFSLLLVVSLQSISHTIKKNTITTSLSFAHALKYTSIYNSFSSFQFTFQKYAPDGKKSPLTKELSLILCSTFYQFNQTSRGLKKLRLLGPSSFLFRFTIPSFSTLVNDPLIPATSPFRASDDRLRETPPKAFSFFNFGLTGMLASAEPLTGARTLRGWGLLGSLKSRRPGVSVSASDVLVSMTMVVFIMSVFSTLVMLVEVC